MRLDRRLNLILSVTRDDDSMIWVHHTPVRREVFEEHFLVLTKTISSMYEQGLPPPMASRIALLMLRKVADDMGLRPTVDGALLPEMWRMTNVMVSGLGMNGSGWSTLPFEKVVADKLIDEEDAQEVRNYVVFFTAASWVHKKDELERMLYPMLRDSGLQITSSTSTDLLASLPTLTPPVSTGVTATPSVIPS